MSVPAALPAELAPTFRTGGERRLQRRDDASSPRPDHAWTSAAEGNPVATRGTPALRYS